MENSIYKTIQDWYDLLKNGVITEAEFIAKKNELLGKEKTTTEVIKDAPETNENKKDFHSYYEKNQEEFEENKESFVSKYLLFIILGTICIVIFSFYYYTKKHNKTKMPLIEQTAGETKMDTIESLKYIDLLKEHIKKEWRKIDNPSGDSTKVGSMKEEDGGLMIRDLDGNWLSHYYEPEVFKGDIDNNGISEIIIVILNSGGGAGGNIEIPENYLIVDNVVTQIGGELINPPKNEFGYSYYLKGIEEGRIIIDFVFKNENDGFYAQGESIKLKCRLTENKLEVVN
jgi:hypothetical protein